LLVNIVDYFQEIKLRGCL